MSAKQRAAITVSMGKIRSHPGRTMPIALKISDTPIKRIKLSDNPSTPVCPRATKVRSEKTDLQTPEYRNVKAIKPCKSNGKWYLAALTCALWVRLIFLS